MEARLPAVTTTLQGMLERLPAGAAGVMVGPVPLAVIVLLGAMAVATVTDLRERRVPLWLTASGIGGGLLVAAAAGGPEGHAIRHSAIGLLVGVLLLAPFVLLGGVGAGDALLLGLVGAWHGWTFTLWTAWWASLAGGALALVALARRQRSLPYVPAIAAGALIALAVPLAAPLVARP